MPEGEQQQDPAVLIEQLEKYVGRIDERAAEAGVSEGTYFELSALGLPEISSASGVLDERARVNLLKQLGAVTGSQGTSRVLLEATRKQQVPVIIEGAKRLLAAVSTAGGEVTKEDAEAAVAPSGAPISRVVTILKILEIVAGVKGRTGGVRLATQAVADVAKAEQDFAAKAKATAAEQPETKTREHEEVYYPLAVDALQIEGFEPTITGVRQRAPGEWSTPDVVGFSVRATNALIVPVVRIGTVEVKHRLTRSGIAEAAAHRRFAHYAYIAVPEVFLEIAPELREECVRSGVGLMCFKQRNSVALQLFIDPLLNRPDEELTDDLLMTLTMDDERSIGAHVAEQIRVAMGLALFGSERRG